MKLVVDRPTDRPSDRPTDIVKYRASIAAKKKNTEIKELNLKIIKEELIETRRVQDTEIEKIRSVQKCLEESNKKYEKTLTEKGEKINGLEEGNSLMYKESARKCKKRNGSRFWWGQTEA